jgi:hypothetical protein
MVKLSEEIGLLEDFLFYDWYWKVLDLVSGVDTFHGYPLVP